MREIQIGDRFLSLGGWAVECQLTDIIENTYYEFDYCFYIPINELTKYFRVEHLELIDGRYYWPSNSWDYQR